MEKREIFNFSYLLIVMHIFYFSLTLLRESIVIVYVFLFRVFLGFSFSHHKGLSPGLSLNSIPCRIPCTLAKEIENYKLMKTLYCP